VPRVAFRLLAIGGFAVALSTTTGALDLTAPRANIPAQVRVVQPPVTLVKPQPATVRARPDASVVPPGVTQQIPLNPTTSNGPTISNVNTPAGGPELAGKNASQTGTASADTNAPPGRAKYSLSSSDSSNHPGTNGSSTGESSRSNGQHCRSRNGASLPACR
jgi:hypothetical protein